MKRIFSLTAAMIAAAAVSASAVDSSANGAIDFWAVNYIDGGSTDDGWSYMISDENEKYEKHICLIDYSGRETDIVVPDEIEGLPVRRLLECFESRYYGYGDDYPYDDFEITSIVIPASVTEINAPLKNFPMLKKLVFEGDELRFYSMSFFSNLGIEEVVLPKLLPDSSDRVYLCFSNNPELRRVGFKAVDDVFRIPNSSFCDCPKLAEVDIPENCTELVIGSNAFNNTGFTELDFSLPVEVEFSAFNNCEKLEKLTFHDDCKANGFSFGSCTSLREVSFESSAALSPNTFSGCTALENLNLPDGCAVNGNSFSNCPALRYINSEPVFDESTGGFSPDMLSIVRQSFSGTDNVGFINDYIYSQIKQVTDTEITPDMTDIQKLRVIHDWICAHTEYESDPMHYGALTNHVDSSVFLSNTSVCEGYARAVNLFCHEAGLESCYVKSRNHAWNLVKIGGHWLHTDATWDDVNGNTDWFLRSDSELISAGDAHSSWEISVPSELHSFQCRELPKSGDPMGDVNTDGKVGAADLVAFGRYLLGAQEISGDDIVLADLDFDGSYDCFDMVYLRRKAIDCFNMETPALREQT